MGAVTYTLWPASEGATHCVAPGQAVALDASINGTVMLDGEPLIHGMVQVFDESGRVYPAPIQDGEFSLPAAPVGKVRVAVQAPPVMPVHPQDGPPKLLTFPPKYLHPRTSGLVGEMVTGAQDITLDLKSQSR